MVLHTEDQLRLAHTADVLHIDATGGIVRNSIYTKRRVYLFSIVPESKIDDMECVSVSDYLSERLRVEDVTYWLMTFLNGMHRVCGEKLTTKAAKIIVTDASWALIHASLFTFGHTTIHAYLDASFRTFTTKTDRRPCILFLCSSHVIARVAKTVTGFDKSEEKHFFLYCFGTLLTATCMEEAANVWEKMVTLFGSKNYTTAVCGAESTLSEIDLASTKTIPSTSSVEDFLEDDWFFESSPFKEFFGRIYDKIHSSSSSFPSIPNPHLNIAALHLLLRQWLPIFGLWNATALVGTGYNHVSNAKIESWFS